MMKFLAKLSTSLVVLVVAFTPTAQADCAVEFDICESGCAIKYFDDKAADLGCRSRCVAEQSVCLAKAGAEKTAEVSRDAWDDTKSFFKGLTEEKQ